LRLFAICELVLGIFSAKELNLNKKTTRHF